MRVHVCCYCCINYSLAIFTSQRISVLSFSISYFSQSRPLCPQRGDCGQTYKSSPPTQPHKSMPADFYWPITHWVMVVWAGRLSPQQCHRAGCAVVCGCEWMGMREEGGVSPLYQTDRPLDSSAARWRTSGLQPMFRSSGRSLPGPWENKVVRLHLFSVPVPWGIKGEDITSCPAWLGPTHLRGPFSPRSLWALFTHPADMACGTVVALLGKNSRRGRGVEEAVLAGREAAEGTNSTVQKREEAL